MLLYPPLFFPWKSTTAVLIRITNRHTQLDWISVGDFLEVQAYLNGVGTL